ncbi:hypothetical protein FOZ63_024914 [Perkinsus olseni]|uniref:Glutathione S-transferase n=1 Tax=Perkinsus olseni TaxID=32597 RepID=A0A7J6QK13_PEROL|nr:hypothetical protein FOZ62_005590 [Perkinsus olseni]KAF4753123.1 hypothetical protein FOZ63_024914 [Perkinsus olseni]
MSAMAEAQKKDHIYMYQFSNKGTGSSATISHFCAKLQVWLELAGLPYTLINHELPAGPYNKLPYIELNGEQYGETAIIIDMLSNKYDKDFDSGLSNEQKALGNAVKRMFEEHTFFLCVNDRWFNNLDLFGGHFIGTVQSYPVFMRPLVKQIAKRRLLGATYTQGVGRLPEEERKKRLHEDISALSTILGEKKYILSDDKPTTVDATVFGFMWCELGVDPEYEKVCAFCQECKKYDNLMSYYERMMKLMNRSK